MSKLTELLTNIANAIRSKKGTTEPINAQNFASEIERLKANTLKNLLDYSKSCFNMFNTNRQITDLTDYISFEDTSNVINMDQMFYSCPYLYKIPPLDTSKVTTMRSMFNNCSRLYSVPLLDASNVTFMNSMFINCSKLTNLTLLNIKVNLQVGSGSSWGHLLTLESLIGLCQECVNVNTSRTLTVGTVNLEKLANIYVKLTGEPEEDETLPKLPMVQCESTDEGAMLISEYMKLKNWTLA